MKIFRNFRLLGFVRNGTVSFPARGSTVLLMPHFFFTVKTGIRCEMKEVEQCREKAEHVIAGLVKHDLRSTFFFYNFLFDTKS